MPFIENVSELAEAIADMVGVYGGGDGFNDHPDDCKCRICFTEMIEIRIRQAVKNEERLPHPNYECSMDVCWCHGKHDEK